MYTGDTEQRQLRYEAISGYTGMHAADTIVSEEVRDSDRDEYVRTNPSGSLSSVASAGVRQDFNAVSHARFEPIKYTERDLSRGTDVGIYATTHAISSVLSAVKKPPGKKERKEKKKKKKKGPVSCICEGTMSTTTEEKQKVSG